MIHIKKSYDKKFYVTVVGDNGETLSTSETLTSKQKAWVNIKSQCQVFFIGFIAVKDDTLKKSKEYSLNVLSGIKKLKK